MQFSLFDRSPVQVWPAGSMLIMEESGPRLANSKEILSKAADLALQPQIQRELPSTPGAVKQYLQLRLNSTLEHEVFAMLLLDVQNRVIEYQEPFRGTFNQASVYPREVAKIALARNAANVIIAHNHPSGSPEPSRADVMLTEHLRSALDLVGVTLLDHILVAGSQTISFAEKRLI